MGLQRQFKKWRQTSKARLLETRAFNTIRQGGETQEVLKSYASCKGPFELSSTTVLIFQLCKTTAGGLCNYSALKVPSLYLKKKAEIEISSVAVKAEKLL